MSKQIKQYQRFVNGIADFVKEGVEDTYAYGLSIDHRSDPRSITLLPRTIKSSGSVVTDLIKWFENVSTSVYAYGNTGNLYLRSSAGAYSFLRQVASSHGNGMAYFGDDDFLYYTSDKTVGRYGPVSGSSPQFADDFLAAQGGVPLNTNSLQLLSASSQYASRADTASLSITGNISMECWINPTSLPTSGNSMTLISKWDESGTLQSYKFDISTISGYFGDGSDGALTISSDTTESPIDSACTGTIGTTTLSATNASFVAGQIILIHQSRGTNAGSWQRNMIQSYTAGTITTTSALNVTYGTGAQVRVMKQYTNVTINSAKTYTAKAWTGTVGGILAFIANGTVTVTGSISASARGFAGGAGKNGSDVANQGEGTSGAGTTSSSANGNGGGGSTGSGGASASGGGGGGNGTVGTDGTNDGASTNGDGGVVAGSADLTTMVFGGGGGGGARGAGVTGTGGTGGNGGGAIFISAVTVTVSGSMVSAGSAGGNGTLDEGAGGGGGAGGSILVKAQVATLGTSLLTCPGGSGGTGRNNGRPGGAGGSGRIHLDYLTSYTGTSTPTLDVTQDATLVTTVSYQLRLAVSSTGLNTENMTKTFTPTLSVWQHVAVSWTASTSTATFFLNGVSLGTVTGTLTSIHDNASTFQIGMNKNGAGSAANFYNGLIDEVRLWNVTKTASDFLGYMNTQIATTTTGLAAYYKLNGNVNDSTASANNLTASGSPTYSSSVPFPSPTTRLDIDQSETTSSQTYTTPTAISEATTDRKTFTPTKDPQKSISVLVAAKGTGNWTLTVHDQYNNTITSATITNANLIVGTTEFTFATPWRPIVNTNYHFHLTSTVADGTVTTGTLNDLTTVTYTTYFQFLVNDTDFHPVAKMLNFMVFGNERYIAKFDASIYSPNFITLASGYKVRAFGYWREYLVIGTWKGATITEQDVGRLYFWDGIAPTFNYFIDIPEGGINAVLGSKGKLYMIAGYQGYLLEYLGGDSAAKVKQIPQMTNSTYVEVFPGAMTMWKTLLRFGVSGNTNSTTVTKAVYTYGKFTDNFRDSLSIDYPISTGNTETSVKIGATGVTNQTLLIGWQDGTGYGVDEVVSTNSPYPYGTIQFVIDDDQVAFKEKLAVVLMAFFAPLVSGQGVDVKYQIDRSGTWTNLGSITTASEQIARLVIGGSRYHEIQVAVDLYTSTTTSPKVYTVSFEKDIAQTEKRV